jgi:hypothetical protein
MKGQEPDAGSHLEVRGVKAKVGQRTDLACASKCKNVPDFFQVFW